MRQNNLQCFGLKQHKYTNFNKLRWHLFRRWQKAIHLLVNNSVWGLLETQQMEIVFHTTLLQRWKELERTGIAETTLLQRWKELE